MADLKANGYKLSVNPHSVDGGDVYEITYSKGNDVVTIRYNNKSLEVMGDVAPIVNRNVNASEEIIATPVEDVEVVSATHVEDAEVVAVRPEDVEVVSVSHADDVEILSVESGLKSGYDNGYVGDDAMSVINDLEARGYVQETSMVVVNNKGNVTEFTFVKGDEKIIVELDETGTNVARTARSKIKDSNAVYGGAADPNRLLSEYNDLNSYVQNHTATVEQISEYYFLKDQLESMGYYPDAYGNMGHEPMTFGDMF